MRVEAEKNDPFFMQRVYERYRLGAFAWYIRVTEYNKKNPRILYGKRTSVPCNLRTDLRSYCQVQPVFSRHRLEHSVAAGTELLHYFGVYDIDADLSSGEFTKYQIADMVRLADGNVLDVCAKCVPLAVAWNAANDLYHCLRKKGLCTPVLCYYTGGKGFRVLAADVNGFLRRIRWKVPYLELWKNEHGEELVRDYGVRRSTVRMIDWMVHECNHGVSTDLQPHRDTKLAAIDMFPCARELGKRIADFWYTIFHSLPDEAHFCMPIGFVDGMETAGAPLAETAIPDKHVQHVLQHVRRKDPKAVVLKRDGVLRFANNSWCEVCRRRHSSDQTWFVVRDKVFWQRCFANRGMSGPKHPLGIAEDRAVSGVWCCICGNTVFEKREWVDACVICGREIPEECRKKKRRCAAT